MVQQGRCLPLTVLLIHIQTVLWFINPTIFNIICWVAESMGRLPHWLNIGCSKHYFFNNFLKNSLSNYFQFILFYFVYNWTKICSKMSEYPKSKPTTHCFIFNLSELYLDHQTLGWWDDRPSNPVYYIEDCQISSKSPCTWISVRTDTFCCKSLESR